MFWRRRVERDLAAKRGGDEPRMGEGCGDGSAVIVEARQPWRAPRQAARDHGQAIVTVSRSCEGREGIHVVARGGLALAACAPGRAAWLPEEGARHRMLLAARSMSLAHRRHRGDLVRALRLKRAW
ncbi:Hypothetical protein CAP_6784 [Chondromyces apiculatus DSM 436]|uniref:Uncharacterized protein n=1 Tax=Chondromyces apiculatus DSM 436 TaxID=1192034 RepID=A0A017T0T5_9BACT|nr:Hypothetical protein CAP_6784 [Chondromyces apiculatus DSM 436]